MQQNRPTPSWQNAAYRLLALSLVVFLCLVPSGASAHLAPGLPWQNLPLYGGPVTAILSDPASAQTVYAGTENAGVFKSIDSGLTWQPARNGLTSRPITSLLASPTQPGTFYAGTEEDGVWKTTNGGATWTFAGTGIDLDLTINNLILDPANPNTLYAGAGEADGHVYKSTDAGATWQAKDAGIAGIDFSDYVDAISALAVDPAAPNTLYAGTINSGVFYTINGGDSWSLLSTGLPLSGEFYSTVNALEVIPGSGGKVAALYSGEYYVYSSGSWQLVNEGTESANSGVGVAHLYFYPGSANIIYAAGTEFKVSIDGGKNWVQRLGWPQSGEIEAVAFHPSAPDKVYAASKYLFEYGEGVWITDNQGLTWQEPTRNVDAHKVTSVAVDPGNAQKIYVGTGLRGSGAFFRSGDGGQTWTRGQVTGGTVGEPTYDFGEIHQVAVDPKNPQNIYAVAMFSFFASSDGGQTFTDSEAIDFPVSVVVPSSGPQGVIYASSSMPGSGIYKSIDGGLNWTRKNNGVPMPYTDTVCPVMELLIDPNHADVLWAATENHSGVLQSTDGGEHWTVKGLTEPMNISAIALHPTQSSTLLASAGDYDGWAIYRTGDGGATWTKVLDTPVQANNIVYDPQHPDWVYLFMDGGGVLQSSDGGRHWADYSDGIFHPALSSGAFTPGPDSRLLAGGLGSGLYWVQPDLNAPPFRTFFLPQTGR